jgi:hypothetical protein
MKLNKTMLVALLAGMALCGCQKDDDACSNENGGTGVKGTPLIATEILYNGDGRILRSTSLTYDSKGRLIRFNRNVVIQDNEAKSVIYTYSESSILLKHTYATNSIIIGVLSLNAKGLAVSNVYKKENGEIESSSDVDYDGNGFLIHKKDVEKKSNYECNYSYTIENGNVVKMVSASNSGYSETETYTYYTDKPNTIGNENHGVFYCGKQSKNLLKSKTNRGHTDTYTYEFDSKNRVTKQLCSDGSYTEYTYIE